jgi:hypothetical protein
LGRPCETFVRAGLIVKDPETFAAGDNAANAAFFADQCVAQPAPRTARFSLRTPPALCA